MFKRFRVNPSTSKADVIMTIAAAIIGVWKAVDTYNDYQSEKANKELSDGKQ